MKKLILILFFSPLLIIGQNVTAPVNVNPTYVAWDFPANIRVQDTAGFNIIYETSNFIDIREYGAKGDSSTHNASYINNAVNAANAQRKPLIIPKGHFKVDSTINLDGIQIFGYGYESHIYTTVDDTIFKITGDSTTIQNIAITGTGESSGHVNQFAIFNDDKERCIIRNNHIYDIGSTAVYIAGGLDDGVVNENIVVDNNIRNCREGILVEDRCEYNIIARNYLYSILLEAIEVTGGNQTIDGNMATFSGTGIRLNSGANDSHLTINGGTYNHNTFAFFFDQIQLGVTITGAQIFSSLIRNNQGLGVSFANCEFGSCTMQLAGGETSIIGGVDQSLTIDEDYNAISSKLIIDGLCKIGDWEHYIKGETTGGADTITQWFDKNFDLKASLTDRGYFSAARAAFGNGVGTSILETEYTTNLKYNPNDINSVVQQFNQLHPKNLNLSTTDSTVTGLLLQNRGSFTANSAIFSMTPANNYSELLFVTERNNVTDVQGKIDSTGSFDLINDGRFEIDGENAISQDITLNNVLVGLNAGDAITTTSGNFLAGSGTGIALTNASNNTMVGGLNVATNITSSDENVFIGNNVCGNTSASIDQAVVIGFSAGSDVTSFSYCIAGRDAGNSISSRSSAFGFQAAKSHTGFSVTAVGSECLENGSGVRIVGVGEGCYENAGSAANSVGIGNGAGENSTGSDNVLIGMNAAQSVTSGSNVLIGREVGLNSTSAAQNVFLGYQSGFTNITGDRNVFIGYKSGYNSTGSDKLYISNSDTDSLIYGDFANKFIHHNAMTLFNSGDSSSLIMKAPTGDTIGSINTYDDGFVGMDFSVGNYYNNGVWYRTKAGKNPSCSFANLDDGEFSWWFAGSGAQGSTITWGTPVATLDSLGNLSIDGDLSVGGDVSFTSSYGGMAISTQGTVTVTTGGTFQKVSGGTIAYSSNFLSNFNETTDGRLTYTGTATKVFLVTASGTWESGEIVQITNLRIAENGTSIADTDVQADFSAANDHGIFSMNYLVELATNDYIEIYVTSDQDSDEIDFHSLQVSVTKP